MSLYKTSRCRFFTPEGKPMKPYCSKGENCRYLHPSDSKWASADKYRTRTSAPFSAPRASRMRTKTDSSALLAPVRHSSPLVPQFHLFRLNTEDDFPKVRPTHSSYDYNREGPGEHTRQPKRFERSLDRSESRNGKRPERRFDSGSSSYPRSRVDSKFGGRIFSSNEAKPDRERKWSKAQSAERDRTFPNIIPRTRELSSKAVADSVRTPGASRDVDMTSDERKPAEKVIELFKNLANLSNQAVQNTAAYNQEDKKLKNYTELSSALSKISAVSAEAVAPTLATVIANRARCKERVENDFTTLEYIWQDIFSVFVQGVVGAIDGGLQDALVTLKKEGENAVNQVIASGADSLKRKAAISGSVAFDGREKRASFSKKTHSASSGGFGDVGETSQSHKRRRLASTSLESSHEDEDIKIEDEDTSVINMVQEMKMNTDRQTQTVQTPIRENNERKASIDNTSDLELVKSGSSLSFLNSSFFSSVSDGDHELDQNLQDTDADGSLVAVEDILLDHQLSESRSEFQSNHLSSTPH